MEYVYHTHKEESVNIIKCKICSGEPIVNISNYGHCSRTIEIKCSSCGCLMTSSGEFYNGGTVESDMIFIARWNKLHEATR